MRLTVLAGAALLSLAAGPALGQDTFAPPVKIEAGGEAIDTDIGHSAPFAYDMDQDGDLDLLVGQFGGGKLRIYENTGGAEAPTFSGPEWFRAGEALGTVPSG